MPYDLSNRLWPNNTDRFFPDVNIVPQLQEGPHCVSTSLAMLSGTEPEDFQGVVNTQDPYSWSKSLYPHGMKLAYCPTDVRKLGFYMDELVQLNDLFTLSYYTTRNELTILSDPDESGWVCGSHIVVMHRDKIYDSMTGDVTNALEDICNIYNTKRIFRVVPADSDRGV